MKVCDNESLGYKLRGVRALMSMMEDLSKEVNDFEWGIEIIKDALEECIDFIEQKEDYINN